MWASQRKAKLHQVVCIDEQRAPRHGPVQNCDKPADEDEDQDGKSAKKKHNKGADLPPGLLNHRGVSKQRGLTTVQHSPD